MQENWFFIFVILLAFSTSLNLARCSVGYYEFTREGQKLKINDRRSAGLVAYPRIGRKDSEMPNFPKREPGFGIIHTPRVGRSDESSNLKRFHDLPTDADIELYIAHDMEPEVLLDLDYEDYADKPVLKHADKIPRDGSWLIPDHVHGYKDLRFAQKIDPRLYYPILRGSRNSQGQGGYTPRLGRESEHDTAGIL